MLPIFVNSRWSSAGTVAVNTDWFGSDIVLLSTAEAIKNRGGIDRPVKHTLQIMVPTSSIVNIQHVSNSITKVLNVNEGTALTANAGYQFSLILEGHDKPHKKQQYWLKEPVRYKYWK